MNELELRRVLAESGRGTVRSMMSFLRNQHKGKYDRELAQKVAKDLCAEIPKY